MKKDFVFNEDDIVLDEYEQSIEDSTDLVPASAETRAKYRAILERERTVNKIHVAKTDKKRIPAMV
jgi:hypothetical protein